MILSKEELEKEYPMSGDRFPHNHDLDKKTKNWLLGLVLKLLVIPVPMLAMRTL